MFQAYVNEAAARRTSPRVGRRFEALERIKAACALAAELKLPNDATTRLRSEAIGALSLTDLRPTSTGPGWAFRSFPNASLFRFASDKDCYLDWDRPRGLLARRIKDNTIRQRVPDITRDASQYHDYPQISLDNRYVSLISKFDLVVWQIDGAEAKEVLRRPDIYALAFVPERAEAVLLTRGRALVVQPLDGKAGATTLHIRQIEEEAQSLHSHDLAVAGRQAAVIGVKRVSIVDLDAGKSTGTCALPGLVDTLAWSPDGTTLAVACRNDSIVLYQPAGKIRRVVQGPPGGNLGIAFDPSGRYLLSSSLWSGHGILWDLAETRAVLRFNALELPARAAHAGGTMTTWWQPALSPSYRVIRAFLPEKERPRILGPGALHPGGRLLAMLTADGTVLGDLATGRPLGFLPDVLGNSHRFDSSGNFYAFRNEQPHRWPVTAVGNNLKFGEPEPLKLPAVPSNLDVSADGRFVVQSLFDDGSILLDRQTGTSVRFQPQQDVRHVAIHPSGLWVASFSWNVKGFRLWEAASGKLVHAHDQGTTGRGRFTPDGKYLITTAADVQDILLWSVPECRLIRTLGPNAEFAVSPDSRYMAAAEGSGKVRLSAIADGEVLARFDVPGEDYLADIHFSPDGQVLFGLNLERTKVHVWGPVEIAPRAARAEP